MNYGALKAAVANYVNRTDLTALMNTFLELAEGRIFNGVGGVEPLALQSMLTTLSPYTPGAALPTNFLSVHRLARVVSGRRIPLEMLPSDVIGPSEGNTGGAAGYELRGNRIVVAGPNQDTLELLYYARPPAPVADADENIIMAATPAVYLFGMAAEAADFLRDAEMAALYLGRFQEAMRTVQNEDEAARWSGPVRVRAAKSARV